MTVSLNMKTKQVESNIVPIPCSLWEIAWYNFAMVCLQIHEHPKLPAHIYAFVDLTNLILARNVHTKDNAQNAIGAGMYTAIESSFEPVPHEFGDPGANDNNEAFLANEAFLNDLVVGRFIQTKRIIDGQPHPNVCLLHVNSITSPVAGGNC
jgi:hypothetical protein